MNDRFSFMARVLFFSWMGFFFLDVLRPGFVSDVFSVHLFLAFAILCQWIALERREITAPPHRFFSFCLRGALGAILAELIWRGGDAFGDLRIFLSLLGFVLPWLLIRLCEERTSLKK